MSREAFEWVVGLPLSACTGTPYRVLLILADRADAYGRRAFPSVVTIASTLGCSTRTVQRALRTLRDAGLIRLGDQRPVQHIRGDRRPKVYDVRTPALVELERIHGVTPGVTPWMRRNGVTVVSPRCTHGVTPTGLTG